MAKIIAVASQKGGVGKTTTALNLGFSLNRLGNHVLILDGDPQGSIAIASNLKKRTELGLIDLIKGSCTPKDITMFTKERSLAIVGMGDPEPEDVMYLEDIANREALKEAARILAHGFDYVIIDVPAGVGNIVTALLESADSVLVPLRCNNLTVKTLPAFLKLLTWVAEHGNPALSLEGVVFTMADKRDPDEEALRQELYESFPEEVFFKTIIPLEPKFEQASRKSLPIGLLKDGQHAAQAYMDMALELKAREMQKTGGQEDDDSQGLF